MENQTPDLSELEKEIESIQDRLAKVVAAEDFFSSNSGQLFLELYTREITKLTREITSDKFRKDHVGYNIALSELRAYQKVLRQLQLLASPEYKARLSDMLEGRLEEQKNGE